MQGDRLCSITVSPVAAADGPALSISGDIAAVSWLSAAPTPKCAARSHAVLIEG